MRTPFLGKWSPVVSWLFCCRRIGFRGIWPHYRTAKLASTPPTTLGPEPPLRQHRGAVAFPIRTGVWLGGRDDDAEQEAAMNADGSTDRLVAEVKGRLAALGPLIIVDHPGACHPSDLGWQWRWCEFVIINRRKAFPVGGSGFRVLSHSPHRHDSCALAPLLSLPKFGLPSCPSCFSGFPRLGFQ